MTDNTAAPVAYRHPGRAHVPLEIRRGETNRYQRQHVQLLLNNAVMEDGWVSLDLDDGMVALQLLAQWARGIR